LRRAQRSGEVSMTQALSAWEQSLVRTPAERMHAREVTKLISDQVDKLDELQGKHFA